MLQKIDHIGIAVHQLEPALELFGGVLGLSTVKVETLEDIQVRIAFLPLGEVLVELLEPTAPGAGRIGRFLADNGPGFHHIAYRVENLDKAMAHLQAAGVGLRDSRPRPGGDGARIVFLRPEDTQGVLTELVERTREITGD